MLLAIGIVIGLVLGLTGAGGSVFAVPLLILLGGLPMSDAIGISLGAVAASTLYGSLRNLRSNTILWIPSAILASAGVLTAPIGKWLSMQVPEFWLMIGFSILALAIAIRMGITSRNPATASVVRANILPSENTQALLCRLSTNGQFQLHPRCISGLVIGGLITGILSGLFGVGGGFLIVPLLLFVSQVSMVHAVSSSLVIITLISSSGFISHLLLNTHAGIDINWATLGWVAAGGLLGMVFGQKLSRYIAGPRLQQIFALSLVCTVIITLIFQH